MKTSRIRNKLLTLHGKLTGLRFKKIFLNVNQLEKGRYELNLTYKNRILKKTYFTNK